MTPLAHKWLRKPAHHSQRSDVGGLQPYVERAHCFELTAVRALWKELASSMESRGVADGRLAFLPAPVTWIEYKDFCGEDRIGPYRYADILVEQDDETAIVISTWEESSSYIGILPLRQSATIEGLSREEQPKVWEDGDDGNETKGARLRYAHRQAGLYAALALINTPRVIGRKQHMSHRGLERELARSKGLVGRFPLQAWTEIRLEVAAPRDLMGQEHEAHLTGERAFHFCRAHLRVKQGRVEFVRHHWRGDPALGIKRSRYAVVPPKSGVAA